jgi:hypothetical protein
MSAEVGFKLANCPDSIYDFNLMLSSQRASVVVVTYSHFTITAVPFLQTVWLANRLNGCTKGGFFLFIVGSCLARLTAQWRDPDWDWCRGSWDG